MSYNQGRTSGYSSKYRTETSLSIAIITLGLLACGGHVEERDKLTEIRSYVGRLGLDHQDVVVSGDDVIVEGDITFPLENLEQRLQEPVKKGYVAEGRTVSWERLSNIQLVFLTSEQLENYPPDSEPVSDEWREALTWAGAKWSEATVDGIEHVLSISESNTGSVIEAYSTPLGTSAYADSFFPSPEGEPGNRVRVSPGANSDDRTGLIDRFRRVVAMHELGHALGFAHRGGSSIVASRHLAETDSGKSYDSVMLPAPFPLPGDDLTADDKASLGALYPGRCGGFDTDLCNDRGASCDVLTGTNAEPINLCRWTAFNAESQCDNSVGIWTTADSGYALNHPGAVPPGADGACITQGSNLTCQKGDSDLCRSRGADCSVVHPTSGPTRAMCRWTEPQSESDCEQTSAGLWSLADPDWPDAVPLGDDAACLTQVRNLKCGGAAIDLCALRGASCDVVHTTDRTEIEMCRWLTDDTEGECTQTSAGIWTAAESGYAANKPDAVPLWEKGSCITQVSNLTCTPANQDVCQAHGASCDRVRTINGGTNRSLCRWASSNSESSCSTTNGIWTTADSSYAFNHPGSVPPGAIGACIAQVGSL